MILVLLFLVVCIACYLYIKNYRYLSFGLGCLFFLWYGWYSSYSVFTFTHEPIIITSTTSTSSINNNNNNNNQSMSQQMSKQHSVNAYSNITWPIIIDAIQTNIQPTDMPQIVLNKNRIIVNSNIDKLKVPAWAQSLNTSGLWSDIDYTSGCSASTVNWLAKAHIERIESMASVWYQQQDTTLLSKIKQSLDYWFLHDFIEEDCLMYGGRAYKNCPCGTPGLWIQAWRSQALDIPRHIGNICLLIYQQLSPEQQSQCIKFTSRSYSLINQYSGLDRMVMAYNGASMALLKGDTLLLQDALDHAENNTAFVTTDTDGIQMDGSYLDNSGQLDNGYHGESYMVNLLTMLDMMILDTNTTTSLWLPSNTTQTALTTLVSGSEWMMIGFNNKNSTMRSPWLWQHFSASSQLILDSTTSKTATRSVSLNITQLDYILQHWSSSFSNNNTMISSTALGLGSTITRLNNTYTSANQGPLMGTRYFWKADYLVHRCHGFVTILKMTSPASICTTSSSNYYYDYDTSLMTYQQGADYLNAFDDAHAWDWNHVPGTTVRSNTSAHCNNNNSQGRSFVGATVLEQNQMGVAVMNFTANDDDTFGWQKTFFFFPSMYAIQLDVSTTEAANTSSLTAAAAAPAAEAVNHATITTTLDQRRRRGDIYLNGKRLRQPPNGIHQDIKTLWHDKILYSFETPVNLTMNNGNDDGDLWTASITTTTTTTVSSLIYTVQPNYGVHRHQTHQPITFIQTQNGGVRGAFSASDHALALAFWAPGSINVPWSHSDDGDDGVDVFIETYAPLTVFLQQQVGNGTWVASISDPTQSLISTSIQISVDQEEAPLQYDIDFPQGQLRGSSVTIVLQDEP